MRPPTYAHYDKLIEAFGGVGYHVVDLQGLAQALTEALAAGQPALINGAIDPTAGRRAATSAISTRRAVCHSSSEGQLAWLPVRSVMERTGRVAAPANWSIRKGGVSL